MKRLAANGSAELMSDGLDPSRVCEGRIYALGRSSWGEYYQLFIGGHSRDAFAAMRRRTLPLDFLSWKGLSFLRESGNL